MAHFPTQVCTHECFARFCTRSMTQLPRYRRRASRRESALRDPPRRYVTSVQKTARVSSASTVRSSSSYHAPPVCGVLMTSRDNDHHIGLLSGLAFHRYNCTNCTWAGRYPHLNASFLDDQPWLPMYWRLENNTYCGISFEGFDNRPLIDGNFDRSSFGIERGNVNSTACLA